MSTRKTDLVDLTEKNSYSDVCSVMFEKDAHGVRIRFDSVQFGRPEGFEFGSFFQSLTPTF